MSLWVRVGQVLDGSDSFITASDQAIDALFEFAMPLPFRLAVERLVITLDPEPLA